MSAVHVEVLDRMLSIDAKLWDALVQQTGGSVLSSHAFLSAFEESESVSIETGWQAKHLILRDEMGELIAAMPLYAKSHSYGEFVFDWAWAEAYERHGLKYHPKWLCAIPFTPVPGARMLCAPAHRTLAAQALVQWARQSKLSSLHVLYTSPADHEALCAAGCMPRTHTQFHWSNKGWQHFDDFLGSLTQSKRKKIRAERRKVKDAGITTRVLTGAAIEPSDWASHQRFFQRLGRHSPAIVCWHSHIGMISRSRHHYSGSIPLTGNVSSMDVTGVRSSMLTAYTLSWRITPRLNGHSPTTSR